MAVKKVLVIIGSLKVGGAERVASILANHWKQDLGVQVKVAVFDATDVGFPLSVPLIDLGRPAQKSWLLKPGLLLGRIRVLIRLLREEQPDRVFSFMEPSNFPTILAAAWTGELSKIVVSVRTMPKRFSPFRKLLIALLYPRARAVVAVSRDVKQYLERTLRLSNNKTFAISNPLSPDLEIFEALAPVKKWGDPAILSVGRLVPEKSFDVLLRAVAQLVADFPSLRLCLVGEGPERQRLEALSAELGLHEHVIFAGWQSHVAPYYKAADIFVLSSWVEGWPNALGEAIASGCPSVATMCSSGTSEITDGGRLGLLVPIRDDRAIAEAMLKILKDSALRKFLIQEAPAELRRRSSLTSIAREWLAL